jgi:hypothetical protein
MESNGLLKVDIKEMHKKDAKMIVSLSKSDLNSFTEKCKKRGVTKSYAVRQFIQSFIKNSI